MSDAEGRGHGRHVSMGVMIVTSAVTAVVCHRSVAVTLLVRAVTSRTRHGVVAVLTVVRRAMVGVYMGAIMMVHMAAGRTLGHLGHATGRLAKKENKT